MMTTATMWSATVALRHITHAAAGPGHVWPHHTGPRARPLPASFTGIEHVERHCLGYVHGDRLVFPQAHRDVIVPLVQKTRGDLPRAHIPPGLMRCLGPAGIVEVSCGEDQ